MGTICVALHSSEILCDLLGDILSKDMPRLAMSPVLSRLQSHHSVSEL